jgi:phosphoglycolate phosphatase
MKYNGVIFDLDGTLVNSLEDIAASMNLVLENNQFPAHDLHAYKHFIGNGIRTFLMN